MYFECRPRPVAKTSRSLVLLPIPFAALAIEWRNKIPAWPVYLQRYSVQTVSKQNITLRKSTGLDT